MALRAGVFSFSALTVCAFLLVSCGGGSSSASSTTPPVTPTQCATAPICIMTPAGATTLSFLAVGSAYAQGFTVFEPGYNGSFSVDSSNCAGVATVSPALPSSQFTTTPVAAGACTLRIADTKGNSAALSVSVTTTQVGGQ